MKKHSLYIFLLRTFSRLPLGLGRAIGGMLGSLSWRSKDRGARVTLKNLALCYPQKDEEQRQLLAKSSLRETGKLAVEIAQVWFRDKNWLEAKILEVSGRELLDKAVSAEKGVIVLAPHIGNWEILGVWLTAYGRRCTYLYQPPKQAYLEPVMKASRERFGAEIVPTTRRGIAELLKRLKSGEITGILPDQVPNEGSGEFSPFFGVDAYTMTLIHGLAQRAGCALIFGVAERIKGGFHLHFIEPPQEIYSESQDESLRALNQGIETCVALQPAQYQWEYKRFKSAAGGDPY